LEETAFERTLERTRDDMDGIGLWIDLKNFWVAGRGGCGKITQKKINMIELSNYPCLLSCLNLFRIYSMESFGGWGSIGAVLMVRNYPYCYGWLNNFNHLDMLAKRRI
jgi:hypothetical protein